MDTDVELKKECPFDKYLERDGLFAFGHERAIETGLCCGCSKGLRLIHDMLLAYHCKHFDKKHMVVISAMNMPIIRAKVGLQLDGTHQIIDNMEFISKDMFLNFAYHYGTATWGESPNFMFDRKPYRNTLFKRFLKDPRKFSFIEEHFGEGVILKGYTFLTYDLLEMGPIYFAKRFLKSKFKK